MSRRPMSLSDLSAETIITNLNRYGDEISKQLSPPGRDMVLDKILSHSEACGGKKFANLWPNLHRLFSSATKSIDTRSLTNIVSNIDSNPNDQNLTLALQMIAIYAPGLTELKISSPKSRFYHLGPSEVSMISKMKNLTHLSFGTPLMAVNIKMDDLTTIVRECKNLQSINSYYCFEEDVAFISEQNLPYQAIHVTDRLINRITLSKILPQNLSGPYFCWSAHLVDDKSVIFLKDALTRHSNTNVKRDEVPGKVDLVMSKVKCVKFLCHRHSSPTLISFLKENGHNLDELKVEPGYYSKEDLFTFTITSNVTMDQVFNWCRNLSIFEMRSFKVTSFDVSPTALTRLRKFTWSCNSETQGLKLTSILTAPLLEEVEIEEFQLDIGPNDDLLDRIKKREILRNLKKFVFNDLRDPTLIEPIDLLVTLKSTMPQTSVQHWMSHRGLAYRLLKEY